MAELTAFGLAVNPPKGWESRIYRRAEQGEVATSGVAGPPAPSGERSFPVVHVATIPLPIDVADYGSDVVDDLKRDDAFIVLKEFSPAEATRRLFAHVGIPHPVSPSDFQPARLQRRITGQAGYQAFFHDGGRAFCLYIVLGSFDRREMVVPLVNAVLASVDIAPVGSSLSSTTSTSAMPVTSSTMPSSTTSTTSP